MVVVGVGHKTVGRFEMQCFRHVSTLDPLEAALVAHRGGLAFLSSFHFLFVIGRCSGYSAAAFAMLQTAPPWMEARRCWRQVLSLAGPAVHGSVHLFLLDLFHVLLGGCDLD